MGIAISDPSGEDLHRRGQWCSHSKALVQGVRCDPHHIGRHGTSALCDASVAVAGQTAKPSARPTPDGFAFVPYTYRFLGRQSLGCRTGR